jgi:hypothetical protein
MFIFCLLGILFSCLTFFNFSAFFNPISYLIIWFIYLNFNLIGQDFMSFEVDYLFIEIGFLAIFYCPWFNKRKLKENTKEDMNSNNNNNLNENLNENDELNETPIENMVYYCYRFLLFRYLVSNSYEKITSGNFLYQNMNYFSYYLQNQAFPSFASYYIYYNIDAIKKFLGAYFLINEVNNFFDNFILYYIFTCLYFSYFFLYFLFIYHYRYGFHFYYLHLYGVDFLYSLVR